MKRLMAITLTLAMCLTFITGCSSKLATPAITEAKGTSDSIKWDKEVDLLVLGAGGSGLSAAVEAADNGASNILIIEKMAGIGGTTFVSQGLIAGYETEIAKRLNVKHTEEELSDLLMNNADYKLDPELTRITVKNSGESIDWLEKTVGVPFKEEIAVGYGPLQMMHMVDGGGMGLKEPFMKALEDRNIELMLETLGKEFILDSEGGLLGVLASNKGVDYKIKAKAVVIATGGYAANAELAGTLNPVYKGVFGIGHPATTGDGIIMASNIGAAISNSNHLMAVLKDYEILTEHNGNTDTANISRFIASPNLLLVGAEAKRFVDEKSGGYMTQELNVPILDQMHKDNAPFVWAITDQTGIDATGVKRGKDLEFIKADTIEELALLMKLDSTTLSETVNNWNAMVEQGVDTEFARTASLEPVIIAPYYAVAAVPSHIITYGGILRNNNGEVLRVDETVIPGVFAAGETSSNSAYMGFTLSNCFTWGRIAGASSAQYLKN